MVKLKCKVDLSEQACEKGSRDQIINLSNVNWVLTLL